MWPVMMDFSVPEKELQNCALKKKNTHTHTHTQQPIFEILKLDEQEKD